MDENTNKILDFSVVQATEVSSSNAMKQKDAIEYWRVCKVKESK